MRLRNAGPEDDPGVLELRPHRALMDGSVKPEGIDLTYHNSFPAATFHRMMGKHEFEAPSSA